MLGEKSMLGFFSGMRLSHSWGIHPWKIGLHCHTNFIKMNDKSEDRKFHSHFVFKNDTDLALKTGKIFGPSNKLKANPLTNCMVENLDLPQNIYRMSSQPGRCQARHYEGTDMDPDNLLSRLCLSPSFFTLLPAFSVPSFQGRCL